MKWLDGLRECVMNPLLPPSSASSSSIGSVGSKVSRMRLCSAESAVGVGANLFLGAVASSHSLYSSCIASARFLLACGVSCAGIVGAGHVAPICF